MIGWSKGKQAGIRYLYMKKEYEPVQDCFYVIVSSELELALVVQQQAVSGRIFLS